MKIQDSNLPNQPLPSAKLVRLSPSYYWLWSISLLHITALSAIFIAALPAWSQLLLGLWVLLSEIVFLRRWYFQPVLRIQCLYGDWYLISETDQQKNRIVTWHFWSVWLMILILENKQGQRRYFPVMFDSCHADEFRWFRVVIKYLLNEKETC